MCMIDNHVNVRAIGPLILEHFVTGQRYLEVLQNELFPLLAEVPLSIWVHVYFQYDGAPAYSAHYVKDFLIEHFAGNGLVVEDLFTGHQDLQT